MDNQINTTSLNQQFLKSKNLNLTDLIKQDLIKNLNEINLRNKTKINKSYFIDGIFKELDKLESKNNKNQDHQKLRERLLDIDNYILNNKLNNNKNFLINAQNKFNVQLNKQDNFIKYKSVLISNISNFKQKKDIKSNLLDLNSDFQKNIIDLDIKILGITYGHTNFTKTQKDLKSHQVKLKILQEKGIKLDEEFNFNINRSIQTFDEYNKVEFMISNWKLKQSINADKAIISIQNNTINDKSQLKFMANIIELQDTIKDKHKIFNTLEKNTISSVNLFITNMNKIEHHLQKFIKLVPIINDIAENSRFYDINLQNLYFKQLKSQNNMINSLKHNINPKFSLNILKMINSQNIVDEKQKQVLQEKQYYDILLDKLSLNLVKLNKIDNNNKLLINYQKDKLKQTLDFRKKLMSDQMILIDSKSKIYFDKLKFFKNNLNKVNKSVIESFQYIKTTDLDFSNMNQRKQTNGLELSDSLISFNKLTIKSIDIKSQTNKILSEIIILFDKIIVAENQFLEILLRKTDELENNYLKFKTQNLQFLVLPT